MPGCYVDTSALGRVLLGEPDAPAVMRALADFEVRLASRLLSVELRRLGLRVSLLEEADRLLTGIALLPNDESILRAAETVAPSSLATLDAIHLVSALRLAAEGFVEAMITYDTRLAEAVGAHGLEVLAPA